MNPREVAESDNITQAQAINNLGKAFNEVIPDETNRFVQFRDIAHNLNQEGQYFIMSLYEMLTKE